MTQPQTLNYGFAGDAKYGRYYKHSGQINIGGVFAALLVGTILSAIIGPVYSAAAIFIPSLKLRGLMCLLYGMGIGAVPTVLLKKFKVRNVPVSLAVVGVVTLVSFYASWVSWEAMVLRNTTRPPTFVQLAVRPWSVVRIANLLNETGTWTTNTSTTGDHSGSPDSTEKGAFLWVIWIAEAACVFGSALLTTRVMLRAVPFCEKCMQWCTGPKLLRTTAPVDAKMLKEKLENGEFSYVAALLPPSTNVSLEFNRHRCETCKELNTLSVVSRTMRVDKKGKVRGQTRKTLIDKLIVSDEDLKKLMPGTSPVASASLQAVAPAAPPVRTPLKSPQAL